MTSLYTLRKVCKAYGEEAVLNIEALEVHQGEILALVGPSGAGKSTLLRLLNFLEFPDSGALHYRGQRVVPGEIPLSRRREVTTVFQRPALLSTSVEKNAIYGLRLRGIREKRGEVRATLERLGLGDLTHRAARTLSGGEAQRVALARALLIRPTVLLLDEPTANLDPYNIGLIESVVREMNEREGTTVVLVTHNVFQARRLADRIALLLRGSIVEVSETEDFFENPQDPRTRAFVNGEMIY